MYRVDVIDRPRLDAVAVLVYRRTENGVELLTRHNLRPAAFFHSTQDAAIPDDRVHLRVEEIVTGLLEPSDRGVSGLKQRADAEVREEAGVEMSAEDIEILGAPIFVAPGILSEKIHLAAVDATGKPQRQPEGDGSPLEEGAEVRWRTIAQVLAACRSGEIQAAKTETAIGRFLDRG